MMHRIGLHKDTSADVLSDMDIWLKERDGYVGEGDFYFLEDSYAIRFYPVAFARDEEDAIIFKLKFGV